jgi:hypothetical protein
MYYFSAINTVLEVIQKPFGMSGSKTVVETFGTIESYSDTEDQY